MVADLYRLSVERISSIFEWPSKILEHTFGKQ